MLTFGMPATLLAYFFVLLLISRHTSRRGGTGNDAFFNAKRSSPWWLVAFGMIGASISGVTFISVPGWAGATGMTYLQMCLGFIPGYAIVAFLLLPLYYRLKLTSIYSWLGMRFDRTTHHTGSTFFIVSKILGAAARLYIICVVLEMFVVTPLLHLEGVAAFALTAGTVLALIWLYTRRSGIMTIVRTDALQTLCLLLAAVGILFAAMEQLRLDFPGLMNLVKESEMGRVWEWDASSRQAFWRQFISGAFIVVVMTGLDQDMMQKNLTCRTLKDAQKNMMGYGLCFLPVNALFLILGIVLYTLCAQQGIAASGDRLLPTLVQSGCLGEWVVIPFTIGIVAAAFSSADSALTALTTTICIDLLHTDQVPDAEAERKRRRIHLALIPVFMVCLIALRLAGGDNILNTIYVMASYTYGPLLGLFAFGLFTRRKCGGRKVWLVCLAAPAICGALDFLAPRLWNYTFGYELLLLNGTLTFAGLWLPGCSGVDLPKKKS